MKKLTILISVAVVLCSSVVFAQGYDPMQTMYMYQPQNINPAYTGTGNYKYRMGAVYREAGYIISRPYRTSQASFDLNLPINAWSGNIFGAGLSFVNDDQGDYTFVNRRFNLNVAAGQYLDPRQEHSLSVGLQAGYGTRSIDYTDAYWNNQWVGEGFKRDLPTGEPLITEIRPYADLSTGVLYQYAGSGLADFTGGISMYHFNTPDQSLYIDTASFWLRQRYNVHMDMTHRIRDNSHFATKPSFLFSRQHKHYNVTVGNQFQFIFNYGTRTTGKRNESSFSMGLFGRYGSGYNGSTTFDMIGTFAFDVAGFTFGAGYDVPVGSFNSVNGYEGAFEFMLGYRAGYNRGLFNKYSAKKKGKL